MYYWQVFEAMDGAPFILGKCKLVRCEIEPKVGIVAPFNKEGRNVRVMKVEYDHDISTGAEEQFYHVWIDWA